MLRTLMKYSVAVVVYLVGTGAVVQATTAYAVSGGFLSLGGPSTIGFRFTIGETIFVTQLGVYDDSGDGLSDAHDVGIWDDSGTTLLASTTVLSGTADPLIDGFRFQTIPTLQLDAGSYLIGAVFPTFDDAFLESQTDIVAPGITLDDTSDALVGFGGTTLTAPTNSISPQLATANFQFDLTSVPEPATYTSLIVGLAIMGFLAWHRKDNTSKIQCPARREQNI